MGRLSVGPTLALLVGCGASSPGAGPIYPAPRVDAHAHAVEDGLPPTTVRAAPVDPALPAIEIASEPVCVAPVIEPLTWNELGFGRRPLPSFTPHPCGPRALGLDDPPYDWSAR